MSIAKAKKRKNASEKETITIEGSSADGSPPSLRKYKKKVSKVTSSQGTSQKEIETATLPTSAKEAGPPPSRAKILERIVSNTSTADKVFILDSSFYFLAL